MHGERRNVFPAITQSRQADLDRIQPEEKILAKLARLTRGRKIGIGGRDHANINFLAPG